MKTQEDNIVILLRKIVALTLPDYFEAIEDTSRKVILDKIKFFNLELYDVISYFLIAYDSHHFIISDYQLKLKAPDIWKSQLQMFKETLSKRKDNLILACNDLHINIDYELENLLN